MLSKDTNKNNNESLHSTRKSQRQHKPNSYYNQQIIKINHTNHSQLKSTLKENKNNQKYDSQYNNSKQKNQEEVLVNMKQQYNTEQDYLPCFLSDRGLIKLQIVLNRCENQKNTKKQDNKLKIKKPADLLSIFQKAIQDVTYPPSQNAIFKPIDNIISQQQCSFPNKLSSKKIRLENENINNVYLDSKVLILQNSHGEKLKYDIAWKKKETKINQDDQTAISVLKQQIDILKENYSDSLQRIYKH